MKFSPEDIHYEQSRRFYWTRVTVRDEQGYETVALIGVSGIYLSDYFKLASRMNITDEHKNEWLSQAISRLEREMREIKPGETYYQVDSFTTEGKANGLKFLREEVTQ